MNKSQFRPTGSATVGATFSIMVLAYKNEAGRNWLLDFRSMPIHEVILTGDVPTREELIDALMASTFPVAMIAILECVIGELTKGRYVQ